MQAHVLQLADGQADAGPTFGTWLRKMVHTAPRALSSGHSRRSKERFLTSTCEALGGTSGSGSLAGICCAGSPRCSACGKPNCEAEPGGAAECCALPVVSSRRSCKDFLPPCYLPELTSPGLAEPAAEVDAPGPAAEVLLATASHVLSPRAAPCDSTAFGSHAHLWERHYMSVTERP